MQEGVGGRLDGNELAVALDLEPLHAADGGLGLALGGAEGTEVVLAEQRLGGRAHTGMIERPVHPHGASAQQRRAREAGGDQVAVTARLGAITRMKVGRYRERPRHAHISWQLAVRTENPATRAANRVRVEMSDLPCGMNAGVGAPGAGETYGFGRDTPERLLE